VNRETRPCGSSGAAGPRLENNCDCADPRIFEQKNRAKGETFSG